MKLIYDDSRQKEVKVGDQVTLRDGEYIVRAIQPPHKPESTGRVYVSPPFHAQTTAWASYFPSVINAKWIGREDQQEDSPPFKDWPKTDLALLSCLDFIERLDSDNPPSNWDKANAQIKAAEALQEKYAKLTTDPYWARLFKPVKLRIRK